MYYYVYILANSIDTDLYKGFSENPLERLRQHNEGSSTFTATKKDWRIIGLFQFGSKREALVFERKIKKWNRRSLDKLIASPNNIANKLHTR
jgi:putative endonuclease